MTFIDNIKALPEVARAIDVLVTVEPEPGEALNRYFFKHEKDVIADDLVMSAELLFRAVNQIKKEGSHD